MVKFSKQFEGQLVPEWKEAFVDYRQLKKDIKKIREQDYNNNKNDDDDKTHVSNNKIRCSFFPSLQKCASYMRKNRDHKTIQVHRKLAGSSSKTDFYETELLEQFADSDGAVEFFACLDRQLNKVNQFYKTKEKEFLERGESLDKQMQILTELKMALQKKCEKGSSSSSSKDEESISGTISCEQEQEQEQENLVEEYNKDEMKVLESPKSGEAAKARKKVDGKMTSFSGGIVNCQGKNLRINIPLTNPTRTFSAITYLLWDDMVNNQSSSNKLHISKTKLHHAEKMIKGASVELYKGLGYLQTYRNLNMLAFVKILKKFDKVTSKQVLPIYLRVVESSYFNSSDKAIKLADEVEEHFVKNFAEDDKRKAMKYLKPTQRKESHAVTFFIGLFTGCFFAFFVGYVIMARLAGMYRSNSDVMYMETVYPVLSLFSLLFLHLFLYGCNIFAWRKARINYAFIFELSPTKELKYRDVFLICAASMAAVIGVLFLHLSLVAKGFSYAQVQPIPGLVVMAFVVVLVCPFDIFYRSSRLRFLSVIRNIALSPLYKVAMLDFFTADQLCSQVPMLRNLEYIACYYITGSYKTQDYNYCMRTGYYRDLAYAVSFLPYYWRAMQCARRWIDEGHGSHLTNLGKYVSAMLAAGAKVAYEKESGAGWLCLVVVLSTAATVYQLYWDFVKDWGLLQINSKNPWLRDELMLRQKFIYYFSMGLNLVLRLAWLQTVFHYNFEKVDYRVTTLFLAALEVVRRGQWNFYRNSFRSKHHSTCTD
ncbi:phosphate transporter PHO1 homolog 1 isoform X2 [Andrographis paniculata]|uniref:phosphate transporter PHO1 homolog 1 isoform X2 n=1 Tax=Andrographis paniculata TaxID=175694 RepID=UPI0021E8669E|nr:phosphate transporter PHO1 homolog 1 isoform X2 [Andrographis paniculata]